MRQPGIEPGSTAWKAAMLTIIPLKIEKVIKLTFDIGLIIINRDAPRGGGRGGGAAAPLDF